MSNYLGIDPGKNGALFIIHESGMLESFVFPRIGKEIDWQKLADIFDAIPDNTKACLEAVHAIHGTSAKSNFEFGGTFYALQMALAMRKIPFALVRPKEWQKTQHSGVTPQYKTKNGRRSNDPKAMSLIAFKNKFPTFDATPTLRSTKFHDGIVDAGLIALHAKLQWQ